MPRGADDDVLWAESAGQSEIPLLVHDVERGEESTHRPRGVVELEVLQVEYLPGRRHVFTLCGSLECAIVILTVRSCIFDVPHFFRVPHRLYLALAILDPVDHVDALPLVFDLAVLPRKLFIVARRMKSACVLILVWHLFLLRPHPISPPPENLSSSLWRFQPGVSTYA